MNARNFVVIALAGLWAAAVCVGQSRPTPLASRPAGLAGTTAPSSRPAGRIPDFCKELIDSYSQGFWRERFFTAAGADNELRQEEFAADATRSDPFVRPYDQWAGMLAFDKNANGTLDWFEAEAYRQNLAQKVLAMFDQDKDGKLQSAERDAANQFLLEGGIRAATRPAGGRGRSGPSGDAPTSRPGRQGRRGASNGSAQVQPIAGETAAQSRPAGRNTVQQKMQQIELSMFDADNDGQLNEQEQAAKRQFQDQFQKIGQEWDTANNDLDHDGKVSPEERKKVADEWRAAGITVMVKIARYADTDGDGKASPEEMQAFGQRVQDGLAQWIGDFVGKFDMDGDGRLLGEQERTGLVEGLQQEMKNRRQKYDIDGDGRLNPTETMALLEDFAKEIGLTPHQPQTQMSAENPQQ